MKVIVKIPKPRNPCALACARRKAGSHRQRTATLRAQARAALQREVNRLVESP